MGVLELEPDTCRLCLGNGARVAVVGRLAEAVSFCWPDESTQYLAPRLLCAKCVRRARLVRRTVLMARATSRRLKLLLCEPCPPRTTDITKLVAEIKQLLPAVSHSDDDIHRMLPDIKEPELDFDQSELLQLLETDIHPATDPQITLHAAEPQDPDVLRFAEDIDLEELNRHSSFKIQNFDGSHLTKVSEIVSASPEISKFSLLVPKKKKKEIIRDVKPSAQIGRSHSASNKLQRLKMIAKPKSKQYLQSGTVIKLTCSYGCPGSFAGLAMLKKHFITTHSGCQEVKNIKLKKVRTKRFTCPYCNKAFFHRLRLNSHACRLPVEPVLRNCLRCDKCNYKFSSENVPIFIRHALFCQRGLFCDTLRLVRDVRVAPLKLAVDQFSSYSDINISNLNSNMIKSYCPQY